MAEDNKIVLASNEPSLGEVRIAPEVIEVIIGIAANKVEGVYSLAGKVKLELQIVFSGDGEAQATLKTPVCEINVCPSIIDNSAIESSNEFPALEDALAELAYYREHGLVGPPGEAATITVGDVEASVLRPKKELKGYEKVFIGKGETVTVNAVLDRDAFSFYDTASKEFVLEPGDFTVSVGSSSADLPLSVTVKIR